MAGTTTSISLASNALLYLGHSTIASFTESSAGAEIASNLYEGSYKFILSVHRWRFATKQKQLSRLSTLPTAQWAFSFQLPSDLLYLIRVYDTKNYEIYGDKIYTNSTTLTAEYIYRIDEGNLPPYMVKVIEFYLASQFALPITGDLAKVQLMQQAYLKHLAQAQFLDSSQRPNVAIQDSPFTDVRS